MATRDRFAPNNSLPLFLSERAEVAERSEMGKLAVVTTMVLVFTAAAFLFAIVSVGNPLPFLANAKASQVSTSSRDVAVQSMPTIEPPAGAPASLPSARKHRRATN